VRVGHCSVNWTLDQGLFRPGNLSLIPGTWAQRQCRLLVAYGVELKDSFVTASIVHWTGGKLAPGVALARGMHLA